MLFNVALSLPLYRRAFIFMMHTMNKKKEKTDILDKIYPNMAFQSPFAVHRAKDRTRLLQATKKENTPAAASSSRKLFVRTYENNHHRHKRHEAAVQGDPGYKCCCNLF